MTRTIDLVGTLRVALALLGLTALTALVVHVAAAADARTMLDFSFPAAVPELRTAVDIFVNNVRVLGGVLAACVAVQIGHCEVEDRLTRTVLTVVAAACDGALLVGCALHVLLIGAVFGAYGSRTFDASMSHGPVELVAFSLALGLYVAARRERLPGRMLAATAIASVATLMLAALLEAFA